MKCKLFTLHSVELSCAVKMKQPRKLVQEVREVSKGMYLASRAAAGGKLLKPDHVLGLKLKSTWSPREVLEDPTWRLCSLTSSPNLPLSLLSTHTCSLPFLKYIKDAPASGLCAGGCSACTILAPHSCHCSCCLIHQVSAPLGKWTLPWPA